MLRKPPSEQISRATGTGGKPGADFCSSGQAGAGSIDLFDADGELIKHLAGSG